MKVKQICHEVLCDNEPYQQLVGNKATWFCCEKGFEQSLKDFLAYLKENPVDDVDKFGNLFNQLKP